MERGRSWEKGAPSPAIPGQGGEPRRLARKVSAVVGLSRRVAEGHPGLESSQGATGNVHPQTVEGFGREWSRFDQAALDLPATEARTLFEQYFSLIDLGGLGRETRALDVGCGSGRWAVHLAPLVGSLALVDASEAALAVARRNLLTQTNCSFHLASVDSLPVDDGSMDLVYSLGVLHHVPDTLAGITACVRKLKVGGQLLVYLYYRFDDRPVWFRMIWYVSDLIRRTVSILPFAARRVLADVVACALYWPTARVCALLEKRGVAVAAVPLSFYRDKSLYTMRTDALDRFGTKLERRFTRAEIQRMLEDAGLDDIRFREGEPYWCAVGTRAAG